jgi:uncharacterized membrane protein
VSAIGAVILAAVSIQRFRSFQASSYDLVIFDQAVRSYSRFDLPVSPVKGVHNGFGPLFSVLGDHISPVIALWAPLYWVHDSPVMLLLAQAVLLAAAALPLAVIARRELGPRAATPVALAYVISWPVVAAAAFDVHEAAFAPLATALLLERLSAWRRGRGRWWQVALGAIAVAAVKEDMGLLLAGLGAGVALSAVRSRRMVATGAALVVGGLAWTVVATQVLIPAGGGQADYYWRYDALGEGPAQAAVFALTHPLDVVGIAVSPGMKLLLVGSLVAVTVGACLLSPYVLALVPLLAVRLLADQPSWWSPGYHYDAVLVVPLLVAGIDGAARLSALLPDVSTWWPRAAALTAAGLGVVTPIHHLVLPSSWEVDGRSRYAAQALAEIPDGVLAEVPNTLGPHLTGRADTLLLDRTPRWAPWVVVDVNERQFPFCSLSEQEGRVLTLRLEGYVIVRRTPDFVVLTDPDARPVLTGPQARTCSGEESTAPSPGPGWVRPFGR